MADGAPEALGGPFFGLAQQGWWIHLEVQCSSKPDARVVGVLGVEYSSRLGERRDQGLVQQFLAEPTVEALDEGVPGRLSRGDVTPVDAPILGLGENCRAGQFGAVVGDAGPGPAAYGDDRAELAGHAPGGDRGVRNQRQAFLAWPAAVCAM